MRDNPIQFAVVREDPALERALIDEHDVERALLVASGGCTAQADLGRFLGDGWEPLDDAGARLHAMDRSLFYERVRVYRRRPWTR